MNFKQCVLAYRKHHIKNEKKGLDDSGKEAHWLRYATKALNYEKLMITKLKEMFKVQEKDTIKRLKTQNPFSKLEAVEQYKELATPLLTGLIGEAIQDAVEIVNPPKKQEGEGVTPIAVEWLKTRIGWAAEEIGEHTADLLAKTLAEGFGEGEGIPKLTKRVQSVFTSASKNRALKIARTETIQAAAQGNIIGYEQEGVNRLQFYTALDERVCVECDALHGQEFPIGETGGIITVHPDCRCVWLAVL